MSELELRVDRAGEPSAWLEVSGWKDIDRLAIEVADPRPYDELAAFLRRQDDIVALDLAGYVGELFPRDGYIPPFRDQLDRLFPLLRRVRLPSWCAHNFEVRWRSGTCGTDGWYTVR